MIIVQSYFWKEKLSVTFKEECVFKPQELIAQFEKKITHSNNKVFGLFWKFLDGSLWRTTPSLSNTIILNVFHSFMLHIESLRQTLILSMLFLGADLLCIRQNRSRRKPPPLKGYRTCSGSENIYSEVVDLMRSPQCFRFNFFPVRNDAHRP